MTRDEMMDEIGRLRAENERYKTLFSQIAIALALGNAIIEMHKQQSRPDA